MSSLMDDNRIMPEGDEESGSSGIVSGDEKSVGSEDAVSLKKALAEEGEKAAKYLSNWQRAQADFINYKRRTEQERGDIVKLANAGLILNLLSVVDDMERALDHVSDKVAGSKWIDGIILIYRKFMAILEANGVSEMKTLGEKFDPCLHEAVGHIEGNSDEVVAVVQKGYMLNDRVLRPAKVMVGDGREPAKKSEVEESE